MRGKAPFFSVQRDADGITPAYAGKRVLNAAGFVGD